MGQNSEGSQRLARHHRECPVLVYLSFTWSLGCLLPPPTLCSVEDGAEGAHPEAEYSGVIEAAPLRSLIVK